MNQPMRQRAKKILQEATLQPEQETMSSITLLQSLISQLEQLEHLEFQTSQLPNKLKHLQALVKAVEKLTPEAQLQSQIEEFQVRSQAQLEDLNQELTNLRQLFEEGITQMNNSSKILEDTAILVADLIRGLQTISENLPQLIDQVNAQTEQQQKQLDAITKAVSQLRQPVPIKPNLMQICGLLALYSLSTACSVILMIRFGLPQINSQAIVPHPQSSPKNQK